MASNNMQAIYPHATGRAAEVVAKHQDPQELVFISGWFCPYVQRTWIALEEKGIPYQYKEVNPYKKEPEFLEISAYGLVPAMQFQGKAMYESMIMCEFLEEAYPNHGPQLLPKDPYDRAYVRIWLDYITKHVVPTFFHLILAQDPEKQKTALAEANKALGTLASKVKGPWFLGENFSLVDVSIAPFAMRDYVLSENRGYTREAVGNGWKEYVERLLARESVLNTHSDREHYEPIFGRYLRNEAQSQAAKATRAGRTLP